MMSKKAPSKQKARAEAKHQKHHEAPGAQRKTCCPQEAEQSRPRAPAKEPNEKLQAAGLQREAREQHRSRPGPTAKKPVIPEQKQRGHWPTPTPEKRQQPKEASYENASRPLALAPQ